MSIILIGVDERCFCDCGHKCVLGRLGSSPRCSKHELEEAGFTTLQVNNMKSNYAVHQAVKNKQKLKIRNK